MSQVLLLIILGHLNRQEAEFNGHSLRTIVQHLASILHRAGYLTPSAEKASASEQRLGISDLVCGCLVRQEVSGRVILSVKFGQCE